MADDGKELENIDIICLDTLYTKLKNNNTNINSQQRAIVQIIGGIDEILSHYISMTKNNSNKSLSTSQIHQIQKLLEAAHPIAPHNIRDIIDPNEFDELLELENGAELSYTFDDKDTILHETFGIDRGEKMINIIHNPICLAILLTVLLLFSFLWQFSDDIIGPNVTSGEEGHDAFFAFLILSQLIAIVWSAAFVTTMNRKCFALLAKEISFWIKLLYSVVVLVLSFYITYTREYNGDVVKSVVVFLWRVFAMMMALIVSSVDALPIHDRRLQTFLCFCALLTSTVMSIYWSVTSWKFEQRTDESEFNKKLLQQEIASTRNSLAITVTLFFLKQSIFSYTKWDRCTSINYSPKINWIALAANNDGNVDVAVHKLQYGDGRVIITEENAVDDKDYELEQT